MGVDGQDDRQPQHIVDEGRHWAFWMTPNIVDDDLLDPYAFRVYSHLKRLCGETGEAKETVRQTAAKCGMSVGKALEARMKLDEGGWIAIRLEGTHGHEEAYIRILSKWADNYARYPDVTRQRSPHERNRRSVHHMNASVHHPDASVRESVTNGASPLTTGTGVKELKDREDLVVVTQTLVVTRHCEECDDVLPPDWPTGRRVCDPCGRGKRRSLG